MNNKVLIEKFYTDPDWKEIENIILSYLEPLKDMESVDTSQPAETVKAEIIGRKLAYNSLSQFLKDSRIVGREIKPFKNPFS